LIPELEGRKAQTTHSQVVMLGNDKRRLSDKEMRGGGE